LLPAAIVPKNGKEISVQHPRRSWDQATVKTMTPKNHVRKKTPIQTRAVCINLPPQFYNKMGESLRRIPKSRKKKKKPDLCTASK